MDKIKSEDMLELRDRCATFIKEISTPIKEKHRENIEKYLEKFIQFPGALSIISILFGSSDLVKNKLFVIFGIILIATSLMTALYIFLNQINLDKKFYKAIFNIERPMIDFSSKLTKFSLSQINEKDLDISYGNLQLSYLSNSKILNTDDKDVEERIDSLYILINFSFILLVIGVILCFMSAFSF